MWFPDVSEIARSLTIPPKHIASLNPQNLNDFNIANLPDILEMVNDLAFTTVCSKAVSMRLNNTDIQFQTDLDTWIPWKEYQQALTVFIYILFKQSNCKFVVLNINVAYTDVNEKAVIFMEQSSKITGLFLLGNNIQIRAALLKFVTDVTGLPLYWGERWTPGGVISDNLPRDDVYFVLSLCMMTKTMDADFQTFVESAIGETARQDFVITLYDKFSNNNDDDEKYWTDFRNTLNVGTITNISSQNQQYLRDYVKKNELMFHKEFLKTPMAALLHNYFFPTPFQYPDFLLGLFTMIGLESKNQNQKIYLFGEYHNAFTYDDFSCGNGTVMSVSNFLGQLMQNSATPIDFYIEHFINQIDYGRHSILGELRFRFIQCYNHFATCDIYTSRVHWVDIRDMPEIKILIRFIDIAYTFSRPTEPDEEMFSLVSGAEMRHQIEQYIRSNNPFSRPFERVRKQIQHMTDESLKSFVNQEFRKIESGIILYMERTKEQMGLFLEAVQAKPRNLQLIKTTTSFLANFVLRYPTRLMDIYTIGRMFRKFRDTGNPRKINIQPRNIIMYAGCMHTANIYRLLLKSQLFKLTFRAGHERATKISETHGGSVMSSDQFEAWNDEELEDDKELLNLRKTNELCLPESNIVQCISIRGLNNNMFPI